jgi:hypothetical protein
VLWRIDFSPGNELFLFLGINTFWAFYFLILMHGALVFENVFIYIWIALADMISDRGKYSFGNIQFVDTVWGKRSI